MRLWAVGFVAAALVGLSCSQASAFGRGRAVGGGHPAPHPAPPRAEPHPAARPAPPRPAPHAEAPPRPAPHAEAPPRPAPHAEAPHAEAPHAAARPEERFGGHGVAGGVYGGAHGLNEEHAHPAAIPHFGGVPHEEHYGRGNEGGFAHIGHEGLGAAGGAFGGVHDRTDIRDRADLHNRTDLENRTDLRNRTDVRNRTDIHNERGGSLIGRGADYGRGGGGIARGALGFGRGGRSLTPGTHYVGSNRLGEIGRGIRGHEYRYFTNDWFGGHRGAWAPGAWFGGMGYWDGPVWGALAPWLGINATPLMYTFGNSCVITDGEVYLGGEPIATLPNFTNQAFALADAGRAAAIGPNDQFQPLGVFGLVREDENAAQRVIQLAVNQTGVVRGNYYDAMTDVNQPIFGMVDPTSQLVAWEIGDRRDIAFEAGLGDLMQMETTCLVFYGATQPPVQVVLVRLPAPQGQGGP